MKGGGAGGGILKQRGEQVDFAFLPQIKPTYANPPQSVCSGRILPENVKDGAVGKNV